MSAMMMPLITFFLNTSSAADISTFTGFGTTLLSWLLSTMTTVLSWLIANPICLVAIIMGLIVSVIGMLFNFLKGR